jgi:hypothetical protein
VDCRAPKLVNFWQTQALPLGRVPALLAVINPIE